jgi:cell filamentation protein
VLRNLAGLQNADALANREAQASTLRLAQLAAHLAGLSRDEFADRLTHYYAELNTVQPFRDGNGRTQRAFLRQLALDADHTVTWARLDAQALIHASQRSFHGDLGPMRELVDTVLDLTDLTNG